MYKKPLNNDNKVKRSGGEHSIVGQQKKNVNVFYKQAEEDEHEEAPADQKDQRGGGAEVPGLWGGVCIRDKGRRAAVGAGDANKVNNVGPETFGDGCGTCWNYRTSPFSPF